MQLPETQLAHRPREPWRENLLTRNVRKAISQKDTKRALPLIAKMTGKAMDVEVILTQASTASTNKKRIILPLLVATGDEDEATILVGFVIHEAGHCRFTDFEVGADCTEFVQSLANVIEDPRMENAVFAVYPGTRNKLHDLVLILRHRKEKDFFVSPKECSGKMHPSAVTMNWLLHQLRSDVLNQPIADLAAEWSVEARGLLGDKLHDQIYQIALAGARGANTQAAQDAAEAIATLLHEEVKALKQPPQPGGGAGKPQDQPGEGQSQQGKGQQSKSKDSGKQQSKEKDDGQSGSEQNDPEKNGDQSGKGDEGKQDASDSQKDGQQGKGQQSGSKDAGEQQGKEKGDGQSGSKQDPGEDGDQSGKGDEGKQDASGGQKDDQQGKGQQSGSKDAGEQGGQGQSPGGSQSGETGEGSGSGQQQGSGQGSQQGSDASQGSGQPGQPGGCGASGGLSDEEREALINVIEQVLKASAAEIGNAGKGLEELLAQNPIFQQNTWNARREVMEQETVRELDNPQTYPPFVRSAQCQNATGQVGMKIEKLLEAQKEIHVYSARTGRLNGQRITRALTFNPRVFDKREEQESINTAVMMGFDRSGSMASFMHVAHDNVSALGDVFERHDTPFAVFSFDDCIYPVKDWDNIWRPYSSRLNACRAHGGTLMGAAHSWAFEQIMDRDEERKIILLITDGLPNSFPALIASANEARRVNVETAFVLIPHGTHDVVQFKAQMPEYHLGVASQVQDLPKAIFDALVKQFEL